MYLTTFFILIIFTTQIQHTTQLKSSSPPSDFDWRTGNTTIGLSSYSYCDSDTYKTIDYNTNPYTQSFIPTYQIDNKRYDIHGFIGYRPTDQNIYIVFRGTQSTRDWIDDFRIDQIFYLLPLLLHLH